MPELPRDEPTPAVAPTGGKLAVRSYLLIVVADFACRALRFLSDIVLVRHFSREIIGQLNLGQSLSVQGIGLSTAGLDVIGIKTVAAGQVPPARMATTIALLRLLLGVFAWCGVALVAGLVPKYQPIFQYAVLYGLSIATAALTIGWVPQGQNRMHVVAIAMLATNICYFSGVWLCTVCGWPPVAVPLILGVAEGSTALALWVWLRLACGPFMWGLPAREAWHCLQDAVPIGGSNYLRLLIQGSDVLILGLFDTGDELGVYSMGFKLYALGASLVAIYLGVLLPQLAAGAAAGTHNVSAELNSSLRRTLPASLVAMAIAMSLAGFGLQLLYGAAFVTGASALRVLIVAWPVQLMSGHFRMGLIAIGRQRLDLLLVGVAMVAHLLAKLCLGYLGGSLGIAVGTLAGEVVLLVITGWVWVAGKGRPA
ncbi:MAG: oligosaccharide flippase family protein [Planctomycetes bacterium]|nr:oligosaccharide flippase family protein [Planctomycetota bacterium]